MRICIVYDCLYPQTVGGAERWYRNLAERLISNGHDVTYLTRRQWPKGSDPQLGGVQVIAVSPAMELYNEAGRRNILEPLAFGAGVLWHLLRHGRSYDVVHTAAFPYFSLLAASAVRPLHRYGLVTDWHEVWTRAYWEEYLGRARGFVGWSVQRLCLRRRQQALCFAQMTARRCKEEGLRDPVRVLGGLYSGSHELSPMRAAEPFVMFAGRHIPEKRVPDLIPALVRARERLPELEAIVFGDGPERPEVLRLIRKHDLEGVVALPGFVDGEQIDDAMSRALCVVLPSRREGYGMVVVEAASWGTPSIVVADPDNAATELVDDGINGIVAADTSPAALSDAIVAIHERGLDLRRSTAEWFARKAPTAAISASADEVAAMYAVRR